MASRRVYRGIEEAALLGTFDRDIYPHSFLARRLRWMYREICDFRKISELQALVTASVYGNKQLDAVKGYNGLRKQVSASTLLPYLRGNGGKHLSDNDMVRMVKIINKKFAARRARSAGKS